MQSLPARIFRIVIVLLCVSLTASISRVRADSQANAQTLLVSGMISAVTAAAVTVKLPDDGRSFSYPLGASPIILIDGTPKTLADLRIGFVANIISIGGVVNEIDARTPDTDAWGTIDSVNAASVTLTTIAGDRDSYVINASTRISLYSKIVTAADLKSGMYAHVTNTFGTPSTASTIEVVRPDSGITRGKIIALDSTSITLQSRKGDTTTFTINAKTTVTFGDKPGKIADVHVGQFANITTPDGVIATDVSIIDAPPFGGRGQDGDGP